MGQMEENIQRFINSQDKARKLIQMDARGELDNKKYKEKAKEAYSIAENATYVDTPKATPQFAYSQPRANSQSKLPKEILESFSNNPIDTSCFGVETSILDKLNIVPPKKVVNEVKQETKKEIVTEQTTNTNIDYSMIKLIVEDCIKKYTSALKKSIINENKVNENNNTLQAMKIGNKFSF